MTQPYPSGHLSSNFPCCEQRLILERKTEESFFQKLHEHSFLFERIAEGCFKLCSNEPTDIRTIDSILKMIKLPEGKTASLEPIGPPGTLRIRISEARKNDLPKKKTYKHVVAKVKKASTRKNNGPSFLATYHALRS